MYTLKSILFTAAPDKDEEDKIMKLTMKVDFLGDVQVGIYQIVCSLKSNLCQILKISA